MADLPFLVVHGTAVWIALVVVVALAVGGWRLRRRRDVGGAVMWTIAAGGITVITLYGAGALAMSHAQLTHRTLGGHGHDGPRVAYDLGNLDALALAAALPGHRGDALEELTGRFEAYYVRDELALERWQRLARLRGGCAGELAMLREQERIVALAKRVAACDDATEAGRALVFLGRYEDAAKRDPTNADALIGAERWHDLVAAAVAVEARIAHADPQSPINQLYPNYAGQVAPRLACAELYVRLRAGEPDAAAKLHAAVGSDPFCRVIDALAQPADRRAAALAAVYPAAPDAQARDTIEQLVWATGGEPIAHEHAYEGAMFPGELVELSPVDFSSGTRGALLSMLALDNRRDPVGSDLWRLGRAWRAGWLILDGAGFAADRDARLAIGTADDDLADTARSIDIAIALRSGKPIPTDFPPHAYLNPHILDAVALARGDAQRVVADLPVHGSECLPDMAAAEVAAQRQAAAGDGTLLADLFDRCTLRAGLGSSALFGLWPRIHRAQDRIAAQVATSAPDFGSDSPFDVIRRGVLRRDLAHLTGDTEGEQAWEVLVHNHLTALTDGDALVMMVVWHLL